VRSVTHSWSAQQHPDPFSDQLRQLAEIAQSHPDCVSFFDYCSVPQNDGLNAEYKKACKEDVYLPEGHPALRTRHETAIFRQAMTFMHTVYDRTLVEVDRLNDPDEGCFTEEMNKLYTLNKNPYESRGWCLLEKFIAKLTEERSTNCRTDADRMSKDIRRQIARANFTHRDDSANVLNIWKEFSTSYLLHRKGWPDVDVLRPRNVSTSYLLHPRNVRFTGSCQKGHWYWSQTVDRGERSAKHKFAESFM